MKKKIILLLMTAVISCSLLGCGEEYIIDVDTETDVMAVDAIVIDMDKLQNGRYTLVTDVIDLVRRSYY